ncbi:MAG: thioredoxin domain-containing protein [Bryobacteraceae bacterium]
MKNSVKMFFGLLILASVGLAQQKSALDKATLESYLRYSELWVPQVTVKIDDPVASNTLKDYNDVWVHLSYNGQTKDEMYYVSKDGRNVIKGTAYDITKSPFQANVDLMKQDQQPHFGAGDKAVVNLVVFGDFQCPVCQKEETELRKNIPAAFGDKVRVYFNDFPLVTIHPWAMKGSIIGRCMYKQGADAFWAYHDWVYESQKDITLENLDAKAQDFAKSKAFDPAKLKSCTEDKAAASEVDRAVQMGHALQVNATPTLFMNGRKIEGALDWGVLSQLLQIEIDHATAAAKPVAKAEEKKDDCCSVQIPMLATR